MTLDLFRAIRAPALLLLALSACAETPAVTEPLAPAFVETEAGFAVLPLQLRATTEEAAGTWGNLVVFVGTLAPPNPCTGTFELTTLAVCGIIHHPGGTNLTGGMLTLQTSPDAAPIRLQFTVPPNPCTTYQVRALAAPDLGTNGLELPAVQIEFYTGSGIILSSQPGPPNSEATPGPPDSEATPGPPNAPPNPCLITLGTRIG